MSIRVRPYKIILAQLIGPALLAVTFLWTTDAAVARSVLAGGLISALSNGYFAARAFQYQGAENADKIVRNFLKGEIGKIAIAILLFALIFNFMEDLNELALFSGFIFSHLIGIRVAGGMMGRQEGNAR